MGFRRPSTGSTQANTSCLELNKETQASTDDDSSDSLAGDAFKPSKQKIPANIMAFVEPSKPETQENGSDNFLS